MADKKISALTSATTPLAGTEVLPIVQSGATNKVSVANLTAGRAVEVGQLYSGIAYNSGRRVNTQASAGETAAYIGGVNGYILVDNVDSGYSYASQSVAFTVQDMAGNPVAIFNASTKNTSFYGNLTQFTANKGVNFTANTPAAGMSSQLLNWYEEGTWTPVLNNWTNVGTPTFAGSTYVRVGRQVTLTFNCIAGTSISCVKSVSTITGLPFAPAYAASGAMIDGSVNSLGSALLYQTGVLYPQTSGTVTQLVITVVYFV
jgi:hypothetical protein